MDRDQILQELKLFSLQNGGIGGWLTMDTDCEVFARLKRIGEDPLTKVQFNQLLAFGHEAPVSDAFFRYYWLSTPQEHPYPVEMLPNFELNWVDSSGITSLDHLKWGFYRLYTDGLLWFGNVRTAYRKLRSMTEEELRNFFLIRRFNTKLIKERGPALPMNSIPRDDRYLISEMACKSYGNDPDSPSMLKKVLIEAYKEYENNGGKRATIRRLLEGDLVQTNYSERQLELIFICR